MQIDKPHENMMYVRDVMDKLKLSKATLYRKIEEGKLPAPVDIYNKRSVWRKDQIELVYKQWFAKFR